MSPVYRIQEWEKKLLRHFQKKEKRQKIKPLSDRQIRKLTKEIFLED